MALLLRKLLHFHQIIHQEIIFVFLWFLPFLTAQSTNRETSQCLESVARCLSKDNWSTRNEEPFYLENMKTILHEHEKILCHKMKAIYGNITEHMEELCQPQSTSSADLNGLAEAIKTIKDKLEDLVNSQEGTEHNMVLTQEELKECKEKLAKSQQATNFTEEIKEFKSEIKALLAAQKGTAEMQLYECQKNLLNAQHDMEQMRECERNLNISQQDAAELSKCTKNMTDTQKDINELRYLIRQRYTEADVVNAARENDMNKLRLLLDAGMKLDSKDPAYYGNTPLHVAAHKGQLDMIKFLVERGAPLEARNVDSNTPFIDTGAGGSIPAAKLLIELGANPKAKGWHGETAGDRAMRDGYTEYANWFRKQGW